MLHNCAYSTQGQFICKKEEGIVEHFAYMPPNVKLSKGAKKCDGSFKQRTVSKFSSAKRVDNSSPPDMCDGNADGYAVDSIANAKYVAWLPSGSSIQVVSDTNSTNLNVVNSPRPIRFEAFNRKTNKHTSCILPKGTYVIRDIKDMNPLNIFNKDNDKANAQTVQDCVNMFTK